MLSVAACTLWLLCKCGFCLCFRSELLSDYGISGTVTEDFLDVEMTSFIFRLSIFHPADVLAAGAVYAEPTSEPLARHLKGLPERLVGLGSHAGDSLRAANGSARGLCNADSLSGEQEASDKDNKVAEIVSLLTADDEDGSAARKNGLDFLGLALLSGVESDAKRLMKQEMQSLQQLRHLWWEPQIAGVLQACAMRFPAFGGSVWLVWRWLGEMQLPGLFRVAEHLTATVFVDHRRHGFAAPPQSPQVAFLRFLHLVANFEWRSRPLRVCFDVDTPLNAEQERLSDASFDRFRLYPTIHTVFDPHGFLIPTPEPATFDRFVQNARSALLKLSGTLSRPSTTADVWREVFTPDLRSFDIVLSLVDPLRAHAGAASKKVSHKRYANVESIHTTDNAMSLCGLEMPACRRRYLFLRLISQLREAYSDALILAYNPVAASLMAGGMPAFLALKVRPGPLIMRRADPAVLLPLCGIQTNDGGSDSEEEHTDAEDCVKRKNPKQSCSFELTVNPVLLVSSLMSMAHGLVESVHVLT
ncbi:nrap protein [Toxoplasma gondii RUB]|uniref:Nrap protein n=1 Tax=Toxoplasma gondii RUB TaxID=935652 RepID=A0A086LVH7_TOXGO|nr:nrap protein [Toxoplasma gondii RUB]